MPRKNIVACLVTAAALVAARANAQDTLTVGITTTGVPFTFVDTKSLAPTGAMVDLATKIATENGMRPDFQISAFPALIPALTTGKINLISAAMFVTEKRKEVLDFSVPVYEYGEAMFVRADDPTNYSMQALRGEIVGAPIGSAIADDLKATHLFGEVREYESIGDIMHDVKLGRLKAGFADRPIVAYELAQRPELGVRLVPGYQAMHIGQVALAVDKGNETLLARVNATIAKLKQNGDLSKIFAHYGL
ncbi:amino acid ABC transporter substrate-binding protein [Labrys miyagiensis]|uniref:Amino acid ABC transporter substrate-binding protein n=1 Tax=Labrys miyagiensis TaxID=346912 RepID=A0ABQ6CGS6_9HYPH|nr:ABC transporter substrate-binding protein [Labrys miyagiensis]GLS18055.1 amino acid ABC transporter substrate-binding protein [Labrys miyagiensis]